MAVVTAQAVASPEEAVTSRVYLPAAALAGGAAVLIGYGAATGWGGVDFSGYVQGLRLQDTGPAALAILGAILTAERIRPAQRRPLVSRGARHDLIYALLHVSLGALLAAALGLSLQEVLRRVAPWIILPKMGFLPHAAAVAIIFVAMDGLNWLGHLLDHRYRVLWRFHEVHHSQEDLNALSVFRTHPLIVVSYLPSGLPALVLLANGSLSLTILEVYAGIVAFAHSNTNLGFGPLGRVFVSPNYHRIHHRLVGAQDVNLGFTLSIWDQLARLAVFPTPETVRIDTGIPGRPLKVEQEGRRPHHLATFAAQMVGPFRPMPEPVVLPSVRAGAATGRARLAAAIAPAHTTHATEVRS